MNINQKIQEFLTEHQYQKKRRIFTAVLSLMIVFSVVSSLIMSAISMTMQDLDDDAAAVEMMDAEPAEENIMLLGDGTEQTEPIDLAKRATESGGSFNISIMDEDTKNNVDGNYIFNGDKANISIGINYKLLNMKDAFKVEDGFNQLYVDIDMKDFSSNISEGNLEDDDYYDQSGALPGTYKIEDNKIKLYLTKEYIDYINKGKGDVVGSLTFSGELSRKNDASGDQTIKIGGQEITIKFQDKQAGVAKNYWVDSSKGEIVWTITVKPNGLSLKNYTLVDDMLQKASGDVSITPAGAATYDSNSKKVTFDESNTSDVKIEYRTKIETTHLQVGSVTNKATLQKNGETPIEDSKTVTFDRTPVNVTKDGKADYENGKSRNNQIDWTITITSKYGTSLNGYQIVDNNLPESGVTISPSGTLTKNAEGKWILNVADDVKEVTLNYSTTAQEGNNSNHVSINYPDGKPTGGEADKNVTYKKESEMVSISKNGSYDQDAHKITWTITVNPQNGYSLNGYYLEDKQFPNSADGFEVTGCQKSDFTISNGKLTFNKDITQTVTLKYQTTVTPPENNGNSEVTSVVTNEIGNKFTTTVVSVSVKSRNTITKAANSSGQTFKQNGEIQETLSWKVDLTRDNGFARYTYKDTLSAATGGTHIITDEQLNNLKILAKAEANGNATELKKDTDYTITKTADGFEIKFSDSTKDYNYMTFEYGSTATIPADAGYGDYTFNNKGSSDKGGGEPNPGVTLKKENPVQTISIHVRKDWQNDTESVRPSSITFKVQYQENNGNWKDLKKSGDTYLFEGDADYSSANVVEVTLNAGNKASWSDYRWEATLSGLPSSVTANGTTKTYQYRVQEIKYNGNQDIANGEIKTENGVYRDTSNNGGYSGATSRNDGEALVTNKYYPNVSLTPVKYWKDGNNQDITNYNGDITEITVVLVSKESDGKFYPVKDSNGNQLTATLDANNGWGKNLTAWGGLSSEKNYLLIETAVKVKGETKTLFSVSDSGIDYNSKEMSFAVDGTYYKATLLGNSVQPTADATISVTNTVYETKNITVQAKKVWNPTTVPNGVSGVVVELQRKASNSNSWTAYPENDTTKSQQTLNNSNSWNASWSDLPNQNANNTGRISYTYRVVEIDYVKTDGTKVAIQNHAFALAKDAQGNADGLYRVSYQNQELTADGTVTITNKYEPLTSIELTPEKQWTGDIDSTTNTVFAERPKSITLQLQQRLGENGTWMSMEGKTLTLTKDDLQQYNNSIWKADSKKFENLPEKVICVNADGSYTEQKYYYQLVEISYTPNGSDTAISIPAGETSFEVTAQNNGQTYNGRYSFSSDVNNGYSGSLKIKNTYKEDIGLSKNIVIEKTSSNSISISKDELTQFKKKIGTEDYYIFNYTVDFSSSQKDAASPFSDIIPEGFEFCENSNWDGVQMAWQSGSTIDQYSPLTGNPGNIAKHFDGYYEHPVFVWPTHGINSAKVAPDLSTIWSQFGSGEWYYYDRANNRVYFNKPNLWAKMYICYSIKIKCADLEAKIANGNYEILNQVIKHEKDGAETAQKDSASVIIKNQTPTDLITKTYQAGLIPGYISYTLDINPQGKALSSGSTIDIEDLFKTDSYYDSDYQGGQTTTGKNLVDVLMRNINVYKIDANGDKQQLSANDYTLQFDCSENGVKNSDNEDGAALLKLTIPDATHIQIVYSYKIIANKRTPSVIHGCKVMKNGRYVPMESGFVPPAGDKITFSNTAKLKADSASGESSHNKQEYTVFQSGGTISTNPIPKIYKINTGDYTIKSLHASFLLAKYESGNWYYASNVNADGNITWGNQSFNGKTVPATDATDAYVIDITDTHPKISLEQNVLYKLVEISVPAGYEGSNLNLPAGTDFRALITGYLNSNLTKYGDQDYETFLKNYDPNHYFSFNSNVSNIPNDVSQSEIQQIKSGDDLNIPNNELIDIGVQKQWVNSNNTTPDGASITVELYWSYEKSTSGIPASATLAKAEDLGILDSSFTATKILTRAENAKVWTDLPNGKDGKPIYYYVKETAYTFGGNTYTLQDDGTYKSGSDLGGYLPIYQNNAANRDATVQIQNTQRLMLKKEWKDVNNNNMTALANEISVAIYGIKVDSAGNETREALFENVSLDKDGNWQQDITDQLSNITLSDYKRFEAVETGVDTTGMVVSCVFNLNQNTGEIIVTNKSNVPTVAAVSVQKDWSDGENLHDADTVSVDLYQSTTALPSGTELSEAWLTTNATKLADKTVTLNKDNDWSYTWAELPLKNDSDQPYYYYVWENSAESKIANADKYTVSYTKSSNSTAYKTNYTITNTRTAITVKKQWYDETGALITNLYDEDGNLVADNMKNLPEITLKVYKKTDAVPTDQIGVVAFGDSITDGYEWQYSKTEKCYPSKLTNLLTTAGFALKNGAVANKGNSGEQIGDVGNGFRKRVTSDIPSDTQIVCLLGGTNDIHQGGSSVKGDPQGVFNRLQALIGEIKTQAPNATIFVGSIPHFDFYKDGTLTTGGGWWSWLSDYADNDGAIPNGLIDQYNAKIKTYAETTAGVYFVDVCSVVTDDDIRADGCHPNESGYTKIATAYANAIQSYYTSKEPVQENGQDLTITLSNANNWTAAIDVPAGNATYCVEEVVPSGWDVTYEDNAQKANSTTAILVKNQQQPTDITLNVEKTWVRDDASKRPDNISLTLLRSNGKKQDGLDAANESEWFWEELNTATPTPTKSNDKWTFTYTSLPAKDVYGNAYHYKVEESALAGYTVSYGTGEENGVTATAGNSATLHVTNTRAITLAIEKQWSDSATNDHLKDPVRVRIYRSTNPNDVPNANLTLQVTPETVSVGVGGTATVTANKAITVKENTNASVATVVVSEDGKTLTISGETVGETTITVTDGTMEKTITVTVVTEPTLNLSISPTSIEVNKTATLTPTMSDGSTCDNVTYEITDGTDVVSISGDTVTGLKAGTATIVAERNGKTSNPVTITVTEPPLSLDKDNVTVSVGGTATIQANRTVTILQNPNASIATVSVSGKDITVTGVAEGSTSFTVKDSDGTEKTVSVTVTARQVMNGKVLTSGETYTFEIPADKQENIKKLEVSFKDYPVNKSNDGVDVYFNASNAIDTQPNSWIKFNDDGSMKDLYIFNDSENYFSKETRDGYTFGTVSGNTAIWEKTTASKNEKIIFKAKAACTITQIKITYEDGTAYTVTDFGGGDSGGGDTPSTPTQITLTANSTTLKVNKTLQLNSNVAGVTYSSSNTQVATVDANGLVTGVAAGSVTITAKKDGYTDGTIDLTVEADVKEISLTGVSAGKIITVTVTGTPNTEINGCFGYNDTGSDATNGWYQEQFDQTIGSDGKLTLTHKVRDTYNGNGNAVFQVWHNNSAVSDITYTIRDSSSGGGESGETKTIVLNAVLQYEQEYDLSEYNYQNITAIGLQFKNYNTSNCGGRVVFGYNGENFTLNNLNNGFFLMQVKYQKSDKLTIYNYNGMGTLESVTLYYDSTSPQSLSASRRAIAAAAVVESAQLLSDDETSGVQTQALENTIDAAEVSDADWANGLLLEIDATDGWQGSVSNLPVTDSNGSPYYYWAVEEPVTGYTPSYLFQDTDGSQSNAIKADAQVDGTDIIILNTKQDTSYTLPSTGGIGVTRYYLIGLLLMGGSGLVICYQFRRKRRRNCAK